MRNEKLEEASLHLAASLTAAITLLEMGGRKAAPSNKMFDQMIQDYKNSLDNWSNVYNYIYRDWVCPIHHPGCKSNCGSYGCGN